MSPILLAGTTIVHLALLSYSVGVIRQQRRRRIDRAVLGFLSAGVTLDVVATGCMVVGSSSGPFTLHGILGFSALAAMSVDTALAWRQRLRCGSEPVGRGLHLYTRAAYGWWLVAYVTGAALAMSGRA